MQDDSFQWISTKGLNLESKIASDYTSADLVSASVKCATCCLVSREPTPCRELPLDLAAAEQHL
jgi:hypothetical protein